MPFKIVRNDITKVKADVIVNTANPNPICASGTDLAIYEAAGKEKLLAERANIGKIARGDIAVTGAYSLNAKYIIFPSCSCTPIPRMCYRVYICFSINIRRSHNAI